MSTLEVTTALGPFGLSRSLLGAGVGLAAARSEVPLLESMIVE